MASGTHQTEPSATHPTKPSGTHQTEPSETHQTKPSGNWTIWNTPNQTNWNTSNWTIWNIQLNHLETEPSETHQTECLEYIKVNHLETEPSMLTLWVIIAIFRWFKFTLKPPYRIAIGNFFSAIWDTSHWNFFVKFGLKTPYDIS